MTGFREWLTREHDVLVLTFDDGSRFRVFASPAGTILFALALWAWRRWRS
jgi:hypothetical protein